MGLKRGLTLLGGLAAASLMGSSPLSAHASETYGANTPAFYSVNTADAYALDRKLPHGCKCKESGVSDANCDLFECSCACDMTAGQCDWNCCCDRECTDDQVARFEAIDSCLPEGAASHEITKCYNDAELETINPRYPMTTKKSLDSAVDDMMCIVYDNSDVKGEFYDDPGYPSSSSIFDESAGSKSYDYEGMVTDSSIIPFSSSQYDVGTVLPAAHKKGAGMHAAYGGFFPVPTAGVDGQCVESSYATFMSPVRDSTCLRVTDDLQATCESVFDAGRFSTGLYVGVAPNSVPLETGGALKACDDDGADDLCTTLEWVKVRVQSVSFLDPDSGELSDLDVDVAGSSGLNSTYYGGACRRALSKITWTVVANSKNQISAVAADIVLTDLVASNVSSVPTVSSQEFNIEYVAASFDMSYGVNAKAYGNAVNMSRSGNPGYIMGLPLLGATRDYAAGETDTMTARVPGMEVIGSATDGTCPNVTRSGLDTQTINFGQDMMTGCMLTLTKEELATMCDGTATSPYITLNERVLASTGKSLYVPTFLNITDTHVGMFGNADPLDTTQWLELDIGTTDEGTWDEATMTCSPMITSLNYKFLVAYVGSVDNPQAKVISASASYGREPVVFSAEGGDGVTQNVMLSTTVSFITYKGTESKAYAPPAPPILFTMPYDVFYPFSINSAAGTRVSYVVVALLVTLTSAALLVQAD
eukprot:CAMPEP_0119503752 /NCGR_PEP_ID=MMETSP1344-20130328/24819_1 /TAXON_ID=236787 /ORGANISM="Florenciella parvula, Strain CCMP2471" /LENGTH=703 /DNA_ID=CAMNT_0007540073 /DNA_START=55 /DNA_END=2166 /DNA_ORIENTATION=-